MTVDKIRLLIPFLLLAQAEEGLEPLRLKRGEKSFRTNFKFQVNISNTWFLPQEGFPAFYRYFNDKVTWNEAEAACGFHHAELLSVQTNSQMDAARVYLKEIDVTDNIWIGLRKESPEKPFSWTNGEKLLGEGYWTEPIPKTNERLCAALDPVFDFRWNSFYCRGPQVASFVCELPVPEWAKTKNGCLITSLPSLTVTLVPEIGVIQLLSDCGLDGTRRIACNGELNREEIIKRLSCDIDAFASTAFSRSTTANSVKEINAQANSWPDLRNQINRFETTKTYLSHTRHRRNANSSETSTANNLVQEGTNSPPKSDKTTSTTFLNIPSHAFPHSPYLASVRNAPSTRKPLESKPTTTGPPTKDRSPSYSTYTPSVDSKPLYEDVPVLIISGEKSNESASSGTSENPQLVLMIENKELNEPFLVPLSDDIFINDPSLSPVEVINVDLVEDDNLTANDTANRTTPIVPPDAPTFASPLRFAEASMNSTRSGTNSRPKMTESTESLNAAEEDKGADVPLRPNRGRLLTRSSHSSFYPRFLNRVLG